MKQFKIVAAALLTGAALAAVPAGVIAVSAAATDPATAVVAADTGRGDGSLVRVGDRQLQEAPLTVGARRENAQIARSGYVTRP